MRHDTFFSENAWAQVLSPVCPLPCHNLVHPTTGESKSLRPRWQKRRCSLFVCNTHGPPYPSCDTRGIWHTHPRTGVRPPDIILWLETSVSVIKDHLPPYVINSWPFPSRLTKVALSFNPVGVIRFVQGLILMSWKNTTAEQWSQRSSSHGTNLFPSFILKIRMNKMVTTTKWICVFLWGGVKSSVTQWYLQFLIHHHTASLLGV